MTRTLIHTEIFHAMLAQDRVCVKTETREFEGLIYEIGLSPFSGETRARLVDDEGRVHYFFIERADVKLAWAS